MNLLNFRLVLLAGLVLIGLSKAVPAQAQTGNASDVTGNIITTGDIAGGAFQPQPSTPVRGTPVAAAINAALDRAVAQLSAGTLAPPTTGLTAGVTQITYRNAQASLYSQLVSPGGGAATLLNSLTAQGAPAAQTQQLIAQLVSLLSSEPSAATLGAAVEAYNSVVRSANANFLTNIPAEFQAIQALLETANNAALLAASAAGN
ncbi:MAG: hypothetical protein HC886_12735 [Leptolyngbyaceae cyanobacterium SM1_1_3]|nr:hypothetical protein [Leptolyngbyaceae cyanobacterium SM1_1_3]NJN02352.1 hypothetical protein [Leptolyngbyaceae cyanobacterium RM1_1_2]NJO10386.1 hypothetical protein [Leptolyngbyaceae cyanobacterium SL_1_1]